MEQLTLGTPSPFESSAPPPRDLPITCQFPNQPSLPHRGAQCQPPRRQRFGPRHSKTWSFVVRLFVAVSLLATSGLVGCRSWQSSGLNSQGVRLYRQGNYVAALEKFQHALRSNPQDPDSYYNLAATYHQIGKGSGRPLEFNQAETHYRQCIALSPFHVDAHRGLAVLMVDRGESEQQVISELERWAQQYPQWAEPKIEVARIYQDFARRADGTGQVSRGHLATARSWLEEAVIADPSNARALAALGYINEQLGETKQALLDYQRSLQSNPGQPALAQKVTRLQQAIVPAGSPSNPGTRFADAQTRQPRQ